MTVIPSAWQKSRRRTSRELVERLSAGYGGESNLESADAPTRGYKERGFRGWMLEGNEDEGC